MTNIELLDLMGVLPEDQTINKMIDKYFCEAVTMGTITTAPICRIVITSNPQSNTNNMYIKEDVLAIEVFVPNGTSQALFRDRMPGFEVLERRSYLIVDKILEILNNKPVNDRMLRLVTRHELACNTVGFCRHFIQFSYLRVYS